MNDQFTTEDVGKLLAANDVLKRARIYQGSTERPAKVQVLTIALDTAKLATDPLRIGFPFKSMFITTATDTNVELSVLAGTRDSLQSAFPMHKNDSWNSEEPISEAYLYWAAQSGKSITIIFFIDSMFNSGSQISVSSGGVTLSDGSTISAASRTTLAATTAAVIAAADSTRKVTTLYNNTGGTLYVGGDATVTSSGATTGIGYPNQAIFQHRNTGALYGYSVAGGDVVKVTES